MSDDDRPLPDRIKRALDAVVEGPGRIATTAHPDCVCGKVVGYLRWTSVKPVQERPIYGQKADCPQHKPERA